MDKRYIGAAIIAPSLLIFFIGGIYLKYFVMILALLGLYEFYKTSKHCGIKPVAIVGYALCLVHFITLKSTLDLELFFYVLIIAVFLLLCVPVIKTDYNFIDVAVTIFGYLYVVVFFSFIVLIENKIHGSYLIWLIFISSWGCDTLAYYSGKYLGKHKLIPKVSPKKTIEGSIGGLLGSIIGCTLYGYVISKYGVNISIYNYVIIGTLGGIFGQFGDLVASSIKRYAKVKDYSNLIPGHGGILDRFDSILFVSVIIYYYITIFMGI